MGEDCKGELFDVDSSLILGLSDGIGGVLKILPPAKALYRAMCKFRMQHQAVFRHGPQRYPVSGRPPKRGILRALRISLGRDESAGMTRVFANCADADRLNIGYLSRGWKGVSTDGSTHGSMEIHGIDCNPHRNGSSGA